MLGKELVGYSRRGEPNPKAGDDLHPRGRIAGLDYKGDSFPTHADGAHQVERSGGIISTQVFSGIYERFG